MYHSYEKGTLKHAQGFLFRVSFIGGSIETGVLAFLWYNPQFMIYIAMPL